MDHVLVTFIAAPPTPPVLMVVLLHTEASGKRLF